jgi:hypothetical protein
MLLLRMCRALEVADRRMPTAVQLVLTHALVAGSTALVGQWMRHRGLHRRPFAEQGPSTRRLHLGSQLLLQLFVFAAGHAAALSVCGWGALGSQGTRGTRRRRTLRRRAGAHGDSLAPRTGHRPTRKGQDAILLRE